MKRPPRIFKLRNEVDTAGVMYNAGNTIDTINTQAGTYGEKDTDALTPQNISLVCLTLCK